MCLTNDDIRTRTFERRQIRSLRLLKVLHVGIKNFCSSLIDGVTYSFDINRIESFFFQTFDLAK